MIREAKRVKIFTGNANINLARQIAEKCGLPLGDANIVRFKDGEVYARITETVRGCDVFIVQPTSEPVNENLMELLIFIDALKRASVKSINVVLPFAFKSSRTPTCPSFRFRYEHSAELYGCADRKSAGNELQCQRVLV